VGRRRVAWLVVLVAVLAVAGWPVGRVGAAFSLKPVPVYGADDVACPLKAARHGRPLKHRHRRGFSGQEKPAGQAAYDCIVAAETADGYVVLVDAIGSARDPVSVWPEEKVAPLAGFYARAASLYAGRRGFGSTVAWAEAFQISPDRPLVLVYDPVHPSDPCPTAAWRAGGVPTITYGPTIRTATASLGLQTALHEMAHIWDGARGWALSAGMADVVGDAGSPPTAKAQNGGPLEDFAESVTAYFVQGYASNARWSDDDARFYGGLGVAPDELWSYDRYDYVAGLLSGASVAELRREAREARRPVAPMASEDQVVPER